MDSISTGLMIMLGLKIDALLTPVLLLDDPDKLTLTLQFGILVPIVPLTGSLETTSNLFQKSIIIETFRKQSNNIKIK